MPTGKYSTKKGDRWYYEIRLPKDQNGERKRLKERGFLTEKEAKKAERQKLHEIDTGSFIEPAKQLYKDYLVEWLEQKRDIGPQTRVNYKSYIDCHIVEGIGNIKLADLHQTDIQKFINGLYTKKQRISQPKNPKKPRIERFGLAPATVKRIYNIIHKSLKDAAKLGLVARNVADLIPHKPKANESQIEVWEPQHIQQFLEWAKGKTRYYTAYFIALLCGMRQSEVLGLRWKDVDFEGNKLHVRQTLSHCGKYFLTPKTEKSKRSIALSPKTVELLKEHQRMILAEKKKLGDEYVDKDLVICTSKGTQVLPRHVMDTWKKLVKKSELPYISFHALRHSHACALFKNGHSSKLIAERLGHSSTQVTQEIYIHVLPNMQEEAANGLDNLLF